MAPTTLLEHAEWNINNQETCNEFPTFKWSPVDGATKYTLQIATDTEFTTIIQQHDTIHPSTSFTLTNPLAFNTYHWRVITTPDQETSGAFCNTKTSSHWTLHLKKIQQNATILTDGKVTLLTLTDGTISCDTTLNLTWQTVVGADYYEIEIDTQSNFLGADNWTKNGLGTTTSFDTLAPNFTYYWHVRGYNTKCTGEWSDTWSFTKEGVDFTSKSSISRWFN